MRIVLTGAPGSGKTTIATMLAARGYDVVAEAATDLIAVKQGEGVEEPWLDVRFTEWICELQRRRREAVDGAGRSDGVVVFDRSAICTLALARHLGHPSSTVLEDEVCWLVEHRYFGDEVLFVQSLGHVERTAARRISYRDALTFGELHRRTYQEFGFGVVDVPAMPADERTEYVVALLRRNMSGIT